MNIRSNSGQMMIPMCALVLLLGLFLVGYIHWCRTQYWELRMTVAARAAALSAARSQAAQLNTLATEQLAATFLAPKAKIGKDIAIASAEYFALNGLMQFTEFFFTTNVVSTGYLIAIANGANGITRFKGDAGDLLKWHSMEIAIPYPPYHETYYHAYLTRTWWPNDRKVQPIHTMGWKACRLQGYCSNGKNGEWVQLWLDVNPGEAFQNGGFPRDDESIWGGLGFQSLYPQFNARLKPRAPSGTL